MKKITVFILVLFMFSMVTPAYAAHEPHIVGTYLDLMDNTPGLVYPANTPFFDVHWWFGITKGSQAIGVYDYKMEIVGGDAGHGERFISMVPDCQDICVYRFYNFPNGLPAGTYTFVGTWYIPCQYGDNPLECTDPNQSVIWQTIITTITFQ